MDTYTRSRHLDSEFQIKDSRFTSKKQIKFLRSKVNSQLKFEGSLTRKNSKSNRHNRLKGRNKVGNRGSLEDLKIHIPDHD